MGDSIGFGEPAVRETLSCSAQRTKMSIPSMSGNEVAICAVLVVAGALVLFSRNTRRAVTPTDYFILTGVRAPVPLLDFDIDQAKARPYRPFRWEYHQTMSNHNWLVEVEAIKHCSPRSDEYGSRSLD